MANISRWEIAGVPAAIVFDAVYELGWLAPIGVTEQNVPRLMVVAFVGMALLRGALQRWGKGKTDGAA